MRLLFCLILLISLNSYGQWKSYTMSVRGDTLNRVDLKGRKQGPWLIHVDELRGEKGYEEEGYYENDLKEGTWKRFTLQGIKTAEENYRWGKLNGISKYYTTNGGLLREEGWRAMDPANPYDTVAVYDMHDPTKIKERVVIKNDGIALKHGTWNYYDPAEGVIVKTERYRLDKLITDDGDVIDDDPNSGGLANGGKARADTTGKKSAKPQAIIDYEKKNTGKKKIKVRDGSTGN
jgi:hypothetical protein